jgi:hypothetical protein
MNAISDDEWLDEQLRLELPNGYRLDGLLGGGGRTIVASATHPKHGGIALKMDRKMFTFPCLVRELPIWLTGAPLYDLGRLNRKLARLIGDPQLPYAVEAYNGLFTAPLEVLRENRITDLTTFAAQELDVRSLRFIFRAPPFLEKLHELSSAVAWPDNGPLWATSDDSVTHASAEVINWAKAALNSVGEIEEDSELVPGTMLDNPLLVWGGAAMEGFFSRTEFPAAAQAVRDQLELLPAAECSVFAYQATAVVHCIRKVLSHARASRMAMLYDATNLYSRRVSLPTDEANLDVPFFMSETQPE